MTITFTAALIISWFLLAQAPPQTSAQKQPPAVGQQPDSSPLRRRYREGEKLTYHMKGINENWRYEIDAIGVVRKDPAGRFFEEYTWSNFTSNRSGDSLPAAAATFRQPVSLDPGYIPSMPDLSPVAIIVGPITDLLTFYVDLRMAALSGKLVHPGDHLYVKFGQPASWADGTYALIGESSIDFDLTLKDVNTSDQTATLIVRHLPPEKPQIRLPASWMSAPVADTPNNWVSVAKRGQDKYVASIGKEIFNVEIKVSLADGKILSVTMDNPVEVSERECQDVQLSACGNPRRYQIRRQIEMYLDGK